MIDGRGSGPQKHLFEEIRNEFPNYKIIYEQYIPQLNQRFDIFIEELGVAIEYDGKQHYEFVEHFHKDIGGYLDGKRVDKRKEDWAAENGIVIIRYRGDVYELTGKDIRNDIDNKGFPDIPYDKNVLKKTRKDLESARKYRKELYKRNKNKALE